MQKISNSALAAELSIRFQIGDDFERIFKFWTDADKTIPLDITAKIFSIKVLTGGRSVLLDFDDYVITAPNILTIAKTHSEMNIPSNTYTWEFKEIDDTVFSIMWGSFFGVVDGGGECLSNVDVVVNNCVATIDVICTIPPSGGGGIDEPFDQSELIIDGNGNWYLELITGKPVLVMSNDVSIPGFTYDKSFSPSRLYGFSGNYTQEIIVTVI